MESLELAVLYSEFDRNAWERAQLAGCLACLPAEMQSRNARYTHWEDRASHLISKLLILWGLKRLNLEAVFDLHDIRYSRFGRPYLTKNIDLSVSHSGSFVAIAIGRGLRTGIDIEKINTIIIDEFTEVFSASEREVINLSHSPLERFFSLWTLKESVVKADGRGFSAPVKDVLVRDEFAELDQTKWYYYEPIIDKDYRMCFVVDKPAVPYYIELVNVHDVIDYSAGK
ncbi:MAG: 4'-phosphopantetheinyl transferase superfamily protein [Chryseolinea sp.]